MKKTIAILLVAILAVGSVFALDANLSGKFTSKLAYDIEKNWLGFTEPDNALDLTLELTTASENEGDIYASVKAEMKLLWETDGKDGKAQNEDNLLGVDKDGTFIALNNDDSKFEITEAAIYGNGWNLSILKAAEMSKYANGWETYNDGDDSIDLIAPAEYKDDLGLTLTIDNLFKAGVAMSIDFDKDAPKNALAWVSTNDLNFAGVVVNGAVGVKKVAGSGLTYVGLGLEAGYENDTLSATIASDMSIGVPTKDEIDATFDFDLAANFAFADMVTVDAYYASQTAFGWDLKKLTDSADLDDYGVDYDYETIIPGIEIPQVEGLGRGFLYMPVEDYLSAKVGFDLNAFDVPVAFTLVGMDLVNNPYFDLEAKANVAGFEITAFGGYQALIANDDLYANVFHVGGEVAYTIEPVGKLSASATYLGYLMDVDGAELMNALGLEVALENTTLVSGATLKAGYKTANIIDGDNAIPFVAQSAGEVYVQATIEF